MNFELLKAVCEAPGIASREDVVRRVIVRAMTPLVDTVNIDTMGNVIGFKKGSGTGPKVMMAAHMDEIGFVVRHVDDRGFIRLQPLGGFDARVLVAQRVLVHGFAGQTLRGVLQPRVKPTHQLSDADKAKGVSLEDLFVDLGLSADEVRRQVELGDPVTMDRTCERIGSRVISKSLDDRLLVYVMLEALRDLNEHACDIYAVATVQEEIGLRGAGPAAFAIQPDVAIALDVTISGDIPGSTPESQVTQLGAGPAIKIMDSSLVCHPKLVRHFRDVAEEHGFPYQLEILDRGGTDAGAIQRSRGGVPSFTLSVPTRYIHTVNEMADVNDIQSTVSLLARWLEACHTRKYGVGDS